MKEMQACIYCWEFCVPIFGFSFLCQIIIDYLGWEGILWGCHFVSCSMLGQHWVQPRLLRALSSWVLKTSKGGDCTGSLGSLFYCWTVYKVKFLSLLPVKICIPFQTHISFWWIFLWARQPSTTTGYLKHSMCFSVAGHNTVHFILRKPTKCCVVLGLVFFVCVWCFVGGVFFP